MQADYAIRSAGPDDAAPIAALIRQLGYDMPPAVLRDKLAAIAANDTDRVLLAAQDEHVLGCIGLHAMPLLHADGMLGRITALVVDADHRGGGLGGELLRAAHAWFAATGCTRLEVTSGDHRERAHRFYEQHGYARQGQRLTRTAA